MKTAVCGLLIAVSCLLFPPPHASGNTIRECVAPMGQSMDLEIVAIPWSPANKFFGYIYPVKGLSVANTATGPKTWNIKGYQTYEGELSWNQIKTPYNSRFSFSSMIVFPCTETKLQNEPRGGILVFKYKHHMGAVEFLKIDSEGLHYRYQIFYNQSDLSLFSEGASSAVEHYNEDRFYEIVPDDAGRGIQISGSASVSVLPGPTPIDSISVLNGTLTLKGPGEYIVGDINIYKNGILRLGKNAVLRVSGDWHNSGGFETFSGAVIFDGDCPQTISGDTSFYSLLIDTRYQVFTESIHVEELSVYSGIFSPGTQSQIHNGYIFSDGVLLPQTNGVLYIAGDLYNEGGFIHNCGRIVLNGPAQQYIKMGYYPFNILDLKGTDVHWETPPAMDEENVCP